MSLTKGDLDWNSFGPAFDAATADLATRSRLFRLFWLYNPRSFKKNCQDVHRFADYYVKMALSKPDSADKGTKGKSEPDKYVFLQELVQQTRDPVELRSQLLNILLAGRDTTAGLLGWTFNLLARHPRVFNILRQNVVNDFGDGHDLGLISFEALKHSTAGRLRGTPPSLVEVDQMGPRRFSSRKGSLSITASMHHRPDIWGPDVEEFKPERWIGRKPGWEFLPFNGGPRICLGQQFPLTEAGYVIVPLLRTFDAVEMMEPDTSPRHQYSLTTAPARLSVRFHKNLGSKNLVN
ncbi:hypothetical protein H2200_012416 [Cladophialophora chaetospira]|uniref:Cytochrome P450 n=1 Tax=Cladophialophora chaetospira TaxID=386627 RepID=A0AA38WXV6_9EURO|nr:hypothetical protein H2200_012416 [Cladophialophora chaetospira]